MGLVLKYVQRLKSGSLRYRRKVPLRLRDALGTREITKTLGRSDREALQRYPTVHAAAENLLAAAERKVLQQSESEKRTRKEASTPMALRQEAIGYLRGMGFDPDEGGFEFSDEEQEEVHREVIADQIASKYEAEPETGSPINVSPLDTEIVRLLNTSGRPPDPPATFRDAVDLYIAEKGHAAPDGVRFAQRIHRVSSIVYKALGRNPALASLKKKQGREVRDYMLNDLRLTAATARRYLNDIQAITTFGIDQFDIVGASNPFSKLTIIQNARARDQRRSFNDDELKRVRRSILAKAGPDLASIWRLLEGTGCRLAEITGLVYSDINFLTRVPYVCIRPHPHRGIKTKASERSVPLVGDALDVAKDLIKGAQETTPTAPIFPRYARERGNDAASAALMKYVRAEVDDPKVTVHSLRHLMKDRLRLAGVPDGVQDSILGHSSGRVSESYGGPEARLRLMQEALEKALNIAV